MCVCVCVRVCMSVHLSVSLLSGTYSVYVCSCLCVCDLEHFALFDPQEAVGTEKEVRRAAGSGATTTAGGTEQQEGVDAGQPAPEGEQEVVPEKLQDDDQILDPLYKRVFFKIFPQLRRGVSYRVH